MPPGSIGILQQWRALRLGGGLLFLFLSFFSIFAAETVQMGPTIIVEPPGAALQTAAVPPLRLR